MNTPIICPHCHSLIDPLTLETAVSATAHYHVCPECDRPIARSAESELEASADPALTGFSPVETSFAPVAA